MMQMLSVRKPKLVRLGRNEHDQSTPIEELRAIAEAEMAEKLRLLFDRRTGEEGSDETPEENEEQELLYSTAILTSHLLDIAKAEERAGMPECKYEFVLTEKDEPAPEPGTILLIEPALDFAWHVDDVWQLPERDTPEDRTYGVKRSLLSYGRRSAAAPRNLLFGFYGAWDGCRTGRHYGISAMAAWQAVLKRFGTPELCEPSDQELREALDDYTGVHFCAWLKKATEKHRGRIERALRNAESPVTLARRWYYETHLPLRKRGNREIATFD